MGNAPQTPLSPLVHRPYDGACRNIAQSIRVTSITSYQCPEKTHAYPSNDQPNVPLGPRAAVGPGCCFSPTKRNLESQSLALKDDSFWDYGECLGLGSSSSFDESECLGLGNASFLDVGPHPPPTTTSGDSDSSTQVATAETTTADGSESKASHSALGQREKEHPQIDVKQVTPVARMAQSIARRSQVKIPVYGSLANHKPFLEPQILDRLLPFIMDATLANCLMVCPHWLRTIYGRLRLHSSSIIESFQQAYCQDGHLEYESCSLNVQPIFTAEVAAVRIDFLIYCKVLNPCQNKCTQLGYSFSYASTPPFSAVAAPTAADPLKTDIPEQPPRRLRGYPSGTLETDSSEDGQQSNSDSVLEDPLASTRVSPEPAPPPSLAASAIVPPALCSYSRQSTQTAYQTVFRFETIKKGSERHLWVQRDMCRFHGDELMVGSMSSVPIVCVDDRIEIPVNIANAFGLVALDSVVWTPLQIIEAPYRHYGQHCELERPNQIWVGLDRFQPTTNERLQNNDYFGNQWKHLKTEFTGIDIILSRSEYVAIEIGEIPNSKRWLGLDACVRPANSPIVFALPRLGLQHDRFSTKQFRQGDVIRLYVSQGGGILQ